MPHHRSGIARWSTWQQIIDAARKKVAEGDEGSTEYSHTFVPETWNVRDEQGNDV